MPEPETTPKRRVVLGIGQNGEDVWGQIDVNINIGKAVFSIPLREIHQKRMKSIDFGKFFGHAWVVIFFLFS
jgi:hypothetical protein